jgi:hypothetical protein
MPTGRPTDYNAQTVPKAELYLEECLEQAKDTKARVNLPSVEGLSLYLNTARGTLYVWRDQYEEFKDIFEKILAAQAKMLIDNGLGGSYNSTITKVMMTKHGYRDEAAVDHTNKGEKFEASEPSPAIIEATKAFEAVMKKSLLE